MGKPKRGLKVVFNPKYLAGEMQWDAVKTEEGDYTIRWHERIHEKILTYCETGRYMTDRWK